MQLLLLVLSSVFATLPMIALLGVVWWLDRYHREPLWLLGLTFLWGAVGGIAIALVFSSALLLPVELLDPSGAVSGAVGAVLVAPLVEEPAKALFLLFVLWTRELDNVTDGFIYGAAAGLGFGMTENFLYFGSTSHDLATWLVTVIVRTLYSAVMHATASSVAGAFLGLARFRGLGAYLLLVPTGLLAAMGIHALWNGLLTLDAFVGLGGSGFLLNLVLFPLEFLMIFGILQACLAHEGWTIRRELALEAAEQGTLPADHAKILGSWLRRIAPGWLPAGVSKHQYVQTATTLAMRRWQARAASSRQSSSAPYYEDEVARLRRKVRSLLGGHTT